MVLIVMTQTLICDWELQTLKSKSHTMIALVKPKIVKYNQYLSFHNINKYLVQIHVTNLY
jgi:hypothetical protein